MPTGLSHTREQTERSSDPAQTGSYRWLVCGLLFAGLTVNYVDRQILSLLKPMLDDRLHWSNRQFGEVNAAFQLAYAISMLGFGWFVDRFGTKLGYAISITAWSLAAAGHALAGSVGGFFAARFFLGLGEGGTFPTSIKSIALWFDQRERALATACFNSGSNVGPMVAPLFVPIVAEKFGWQACFLLASAAGFIWLVLWLCLYRTPAFSNSAAIPENGKRGGASAAGQQSLALLHYRQAWSFIIAKALTDPIWWFFLIWLPDYFKKTRHLDIQHSWPLLVTIYGIVTVLSIVGGWAPRPLIRAGYSANFARKSTMLTAAFLALPILLATSVGNWQAVVLIGIAGAAHQAWSANLYCTASDMFPAEVVATLIGYGGMAGSLSAIVFPIFTGALLDHFAKQNQITHGYSILFAICSVAYLAAFAVQHALAPRFAKIIVDSS
jgi:ACS family hexuronate transporter-like MFS transporter